MMILLAAALLAGSAAGSAPTVETATGDWIGLPALKTRNFDRIPPQAVGRIHEIVASGECSLPGQNKRKLDMTVPFAAHFKPDGTLDRVIIPQMNCEKIESIMGRVLLDLFESGEYQATGVNPLGWYGSSISFSSARS